VEEDLARYEKVTPESVKQFTRDTLSNDARVILHAAPPDSGRAPTLPKERK
jgi:hypothetical protein